MATRRVFVALPAEDIMPGEEGMCGLLERSLYGTRDAAFNWAQTYTDVLLGLGFLKGESSPCTFFHPNRKLHMVVHGDDFFTEGSSEELRLLDKQLQKHFTMKTEVLGPDAAKGEVQELKFLNRVLSWMPQGISWEADPRHAEMVVQQLGVSGGRVAGTPGTKDDQMKGYVADAHGPDAAEAYPESSEVMAFLFGRGDADICGLCDDARGDECVFCPLPTGESGIGGGSDKDLVPRLTHSHGCPSQHVWATSMCSCEGRWEMVGQTQLDEDKKSWSDEWTSAKGIPNRESIEGSPPGADEARRKWPAGEVEEEQGGHLKAKLVGRHQAMVDDGWEHQQGEIWSRVDARATSLPVPPVEGMLRRTTRCSLPQVAGGSQVARGSGVSLTGVERPLQGE
jgi:hypothetical protein